MKSVVDGSSPSALAILAVCFRGTGRLVMRLPSKQFQSGSIPECRSNFFLGVAQLVARLAWDQEAAGSSPAIQTNF